MSPIGPSSQVSISLWGHLVPTTRYKHGPSHSLEQDCWNLSVPRGFQLTGYWPLLPLDCWPKLKWKTQGTHKRPPRFKLAKLCKLVHHWPKRISPLYHHIPYHMGYEKNSPKDKLKLRKRQNFNSDFYWAFLIKCLLHHCLYTNLQLIGKIAFTYLNFFLFFLT